MTRRFALLGHPVAHSLSPAMHNAAFTQLKLSATYELWDIEPDSLPEALARAKRELDGFNVTVPHKQGVFEAVTDMHDVARQVGAINTVKVLGDRMRGRNTDVFGIQRACSDEGFLLDGAHVLVLGSGGAARASAVAAARGRASRVTVAARNIKKAKLLTDEMRVLFNTKCAFEASDLVTESVFETAAVVLQATSATLEGSAEAGAFAAGLPIDALSSEACVMDLVYKPATTTVMARARARGLRTANGLGMLLHQGAAALEWWTGQLAPIDFMREVLLDASAKHAG